MLLERAGGADIATAGGGTLPRCPLTWAASGTSSFGIFGSSTGARGGAGTYSARRSIDTVGVASDSSCSGGCSERRFGAGGGPLLGLVLPEGIPAGGAPGTALAIVSTTYAR
jgi:hypothetical protein